MDTISNKIRNKIVLVIILLVIVIFALVHTGNKTNTQAEIPEQSLPSFESYYTNRLQYENAFARTEEVKKQKISSGVVSHHFLVRDLIAEFFSGIDFNGIETVYIIGPDHYKKIEAKDILAVTSTIPWDTPYGVLRTDDETINELLKHPAIERFDSPFLREHSIYTLVPFLKKVKPEITIVPLILKATNRYTEFYEMGKEAKGKNSILILSSDFSHDATVSQAEENDAKSIDCINKGGLDCLDEITTDCKQCFAFMYGYLSSKNTSFTLLSNKKSTDYGDEKLTNVTSYIIGYFIESL